MLVDSAADHQRRGFPVQRQAASEIRVDVLAMQLDGRALFFAIDVDRGDHELLAIGCPALEPEYPRAGGEKERELRCAPPRGLLTVTLRPIKAAQRQHGVGAAQYSSEIAVEIQ